jgi:DNA polymerase-3 subunit alpha
VFGLSAVRNVGEGLVELLLAERNENGPFADFYDFCERVDTQVLNKRTIESLIKAGAFDSVGHSRRGLLDAPAGEGGEDARPTFERIIDQIVARRREHDMGVMSLFGSSEDGPVFDERIPIPDIEFDKSIKLAFEKEMLGLYVSDHPLMGLEGALARRTDCTLRELGERSDGSMVCVGGVVTGVTRKWTRKGDLMAVCTLEDLASSVEVMVFPKTMGIIGHLLEDDVVVTLKGRLDRRDDLPKLIAMELERFVPIDDGAPPVRIQLPVHRVDNVLIGGLKELFVDHPGESPVYLHLDDRKVLRLPDGFCVDTGNGLIGELRALLGPDAVLL